MKAREGLIRSKRFKVEEKRRQVDQIELMIAEFDRMARELDEQIALEQERSGIHDTEHFAYPTFAKSALRRRDNLIASTNELRERLSVAEGESAEATRELAKCEAMAERDNDRLGNKTADQAA